MKIIKLQNTEWILVLISVLTIIAGLSSFYRYYFKVNFDLYAQTDCLNDFEVCQTDGETYYKVFMVRADELVVMCKSEHDDQCILDMSKKGYAVDVTCNEDYMSDWETCSRETGARN